MNYDDMEDYTHGAMYPSIITTQTLPFASKQFFAPTANHKYNSNAIALKFNKTFINNLYNT